MLFEHFSYINALFQLDHFRYVDKECAVLKLVEAYLLRLLLFQKDTCIDKPVPVQVLRDPDGIFTCFQIRESEGCVAVDDI